ncbi:hypothetical protein ABZX62_13745 [Streptomyces flavidovirens]|uniref:carbohydrate ABC transporter permease n=1 Tax=Streptomyces flavidovirens TaxID=67298 RepID=UPI0033A992D3
MAAPTKDPARDPTRDPTNERREDAVPVRPPAPARPLLRGLGSWASVAWFLVPALVLFLVFVLAPIAVAVHTSFFKWGGIGRMDDFVGFENYARLFADQVFLGDMGRGLYLIVLSITVQLPFALFTAVLLNQRLRGRAVEAADADDPRGPGTPTVAINGTQITDDLYGRLFEKESFDQLLNSAHNQPQTG